MTHRTKGATASELVAPGLPASRSFRAEADLLRFLGEVAVPRGGAVAVVAGRFTVPGAGTGAPEAGDEALGSFRLGARLLHEGTMRSRARAHLVILVDDHEAGYPGPGSRFDERSIPPRFLRILAAEGLSVRDALLPCSEEDLKRRYLRDLARGAHPDPRLRAPGPGSDCLFAGEMVRLLLDAAARQITDVVLFPPPSRSPEAALAADLVPRWAAESGLGCPVLHLVSCSGPLTVASRAA